MPPRGRSCRHRLAWFELADTILAAGAEPDTNVVILAATGRGFNAGVDIKEMQRTTGFTALIDANREDGVLTRQEWLDHLTSISRDPSLASDIELLLDHGTPDPSAVIASLFERAGVAYRLDEGRVRLD